MPKVNHVYKFYSFVDGLVYVQNDQGIYIKIFPFPIRLFQATGTSTSPPFKST